MVLKCEIGTRERKPQVEQYGLDELAASAEAVLPGLGPLAAGFARLAVQASRAVTLQEMEGRVAGDGRKLLGGLVQLGLDTQAAGEVRLPQVTGQDGVPRTRAERGHARTVVTTLGAVVVRRIGYRAGIRGVPSLFPRDAVLNLPPCGYSWDLQRLAVMFCRSGSSSPRPGTRAWSRRRTGTGPSSPRPGTRAWSRSRTGTGPSSPRPGTRGRGRGCRRWRSPVTARAWRCSPKRAAAAPGPRSRRCGSLTSGPGPGRRRAASGWPRPGPSSTSRPGGRGPRSRSCARRAAPPGTSRGGR